MSRLRQSVPSLGALVTFEVAARVGGFTRAAEELGVTQAAVSRQIRALEDDLGTPLFTRVSRGVELTPDGRLLAETLGESFGRVADAIARIRNPEEPVALTVGATLAFSHFWLLPRLPALRTLHPGLKLRVVSEDAVFDLRQRTADVVLRYGRAPFRDGQTVASLAETIVPVCSPDIAGRATALDALTQGPLIESEGPERSWLNWKAWFSRARLKTRPLDDRTLHFNHYSDAVYAAINGEGVVLGWQNLLHRPLSDGRLVQLGDISVTPAERHHVVVPAGRPMSTAVEGFVQWIEEAFEADAQT